MKREICTIPIFDIDTAIHILPVVAALEDKKDNPIDQRLMDALVYVLEKALDLYEWEISELRDDENIMESLKLIEGICKKFRDRISPKQQS